MSLEKERAIYLRERASWMQAGLVGRWVVIRGEEILGMYPSLESAMEAGYERYGLEEPFMARQILESDPIITTSRRAVHVPRKP